MVRSHAIQWLPIAEEDPAPGTFQAVVTALKHPGAAVHLPQPDVPPMAAEQRLSGALGNLGQPGNTRLDGPLLGLRPSGLAAADLRLQPGYGAVHGQGCVRRRSSPHSPSRAVLLRGRRPARELHHAHPASPRFFCAERQASRRVRQGPQPAVEADRAPSPFLVGLGRPEPVSPFRDRCVFHLRGHTGGPAPRFATHLR